MGSMWLYLFVLWSCLLLPSLKAHSHSHSDHHHHHDHDDVIEENPAFKYSQKANDAHLKKTKDVHSKKTNDAHPKKEMNEIWLYAMGSTLLISAAPVVILFVVPLDNTEQKQPLLKILLAFASGGLLGDAFLHLIPHATMAVGPKPEHSHSHSHSHEHNADHSHDMSVGLGVLSGILAFLVIEKGVRFMKGGHSHSKPVMQVVDKRPKSNKQTEKSKESKEKKGEGEPGAAKVVKPSVEATQAAKSEIKVAGYLNLAADFSHNFTDGLAIGASYLAGNNVGLITTITILLHEVPHEIGDFAILLQSGVSRRNAMLLQLTTAIGALAGTALSLFAQDGFGLFTANWVLPFTAGGFIYIALVSVIPELLEEEKPSIKQTILQLCAMLGGVYMMVKIAELE